MGVTRRGRIPTSDRPPLLRAPTTAGTQDGGVTPIDFGPRSRRERP